MHIYSIYINTCTLFIFTLLEFLGAYVSHLKKLVKSESFSKFSQWKWSTWNVEIYSCVQNNEAGCYKYKQYVIYAHRVPTNSPWHFPAYTISWTHAPRSYLVSKKTTNMFLLHWIFLGPSLQMQVNVHLFPAPPPFFSDFFPIGSALQSNPPNMVASNASASAWRPSPVDISINPTYC